MIRIDSHNIELSDFTHEIHSTLDNPNDQTFTPSIVFISGTTRIFNTLPSQPYVNGTWTDEDVNTAINEHIKSIEIK